MANVLAWDEEPTVVSLQNLTQLVDFGDPITYDDIVDSDYDDDPSDILDKILDRDLPEETDTGYACFDLDTIHDLF